MRAKIKKKCRSATEKALKIGKKRSAGRLALDLGLVGCALVRSACDFWRISEVPHESEFVDLEVDLRSFKPKKV